SLQVSAGGREWGAVGGGRRRRPISPTWVTLDRRLVERSGGLSAPDAAPRWGEVGISARYATAHRTLTPLLRTCDRRPPHAPCGARSRAIVEKPAIREAERRPGSTTRRRSADKTCPIRRRTRTFPRTVRVPRRRSRWGRQICPSCTPPCRRSRRTSSG